MSSEPLVSIVVPVYNGSNYLRGAIKSALAQTYRSVEIIVVDDGSDDDDKTGAIARSFGDRIRYFRREHAGIAATLNFGISQMAGRYFSWLSHDDEYYPQKLSGQVALLQRLGREAVVYGDYDLITARGRVLSRVRKIALKPRHLRYHLCTGRPIHGCTLLVPKRYFEEFGLFDEAVPTTQDTDLFFKFASKHDFEYLPAPVAKLRVHHKQGSAARAHHLECDRMALGFLAQLERDNTLPPAEKAKLLLMVACRLKRKRLPKSSKLAYRMSRAIKPAAASTARYWAHVLLAPAFWLRYRVLAVVRRFA